MVYTDVNLREGPGTNYNIIATIPAGSRLSVAGCQGQWCQVTWQGQTGYVIASSLAPRRPPPPPPPPGYGPPPPAYGPPPPYYGPPPYRYGPRPWHRPWYRY